jgi:hypothetical protein
VVDGVNVAWQKSSLSHANGNCVEVGWLASSLSDSGSGTCVEVADLGDSVIGVRNSRDPDGPVLRFTPDEMRAFIGGVRNGEFDRFGGMS